MADALTRVRPGDLITADFMNGLIDRLADLEGRVKDLEDQGPSDETVQIIRLEPSDTVRSGTQLKIIGRSFGVFGENTVIIGGKRTAPLGGTDTLLVVSVPFYEDTPETGRESRLTVSNPRGFARTDVTVLPAAVGEMPNGSVAIRRSGGEIGEIEAGDTAEFVFTVDIRTTLEERFSVAAEVIAETLGSRWRAIVIDEDGDQVEEIRVPKTLAPAIHTRELTVVLTVPLGTDGTSARLDLKVMSRRNAQLKETGEVTINVGEEVEPPQAIAIRRAGVTRGTIASDGTATLQPGRTSMRFRFVATMPDDAAADATYAIDVGDNPPNWTIALQGAATGRTATDRNLEFLVDATKVDGAALATITMTVTDEDDETVLGTFDQKIAP